MTPARDTDVATCSLSVVNLTSPETTRVEHRVRFLTVVRVTSSIFPAGRCGPVAPVVPSRTCPLGPAGVSSPPTKFTVESVARQARRAVMEGDALEYVAIVVNEPAVHAQIAFSVEKDRVCVRGSPPGAGVVAQRELALGVAHREVVAGFGLVR